LSASDDDPEAGEPGRPQVGFAEPRIQAMRAHPQLEAAMRHSVTRSVTYYDAAPVMHRNLKDVSRFILGVVALYLDATGGLTHRRLRELSGQTGIISTGAATALLLRLRLIGYVAPAETLPSGAIRLYRPTEAMVTAFRERLRIELQACALIDPRIAPVIERLDEPEVFPHLMAALGADSINAARNPRADTAPIDKLSMRSAGMLIMFHLMQDADRGEAFPQPGEAQVSVSSLARRYEVSRSHVLTVLRDAEEMGLIVRLGEGRWRLEPALGEVFRTFYAVLYLGIIKAARATQAAMVGDRSRA
jgi:DNA-binding transcriptional ArsR family regulator